MSCLIVYPESPPNGGRCSGAAASHARCLNPGEHALLLKKRLEALKPEAAPAGVEKLLRTLSMTARTEQNVEVSVFGDAPVSQEVLKALPPSMKVTRATSKQKMGNNRGVTALGVADARSGNWRQVDVFFQVQSNGAPVRLQDVQSAHWKARLSPRR